MSKYSTAQLLEMWPKRVKNMGVYRYFSYYDAGGSELRGASVAHVNATAGSIRRDYAHNTAAIFAQSSNAFAMQMRGYLVASRLMWNPNEDVNAILEDFYEKSYGPAKEPMKRFHERVSPESPKKVIGGYGMGVLYRELDAATKLAKDRPDVLWRLADLKMYLRWLQLRGEVYGIPTKTPEDRVKIGEAFMKMMGVARAMAPTYMAQWNMIQMKIGKSYGARLRGVSFPDAKTTAFEPTLENIEAGFQETLQKLPKNDVPEIEFDLTDLVPVEFPRAPALDNPPPKNPVQPVAAPAPDAGPPTRRDYYQGNAPVYNFYSFRGEPIEVSLRAGMRGRGKGGGSAAWSLSKPDGKGGRKVVATGSVPEDRSLQNLSIPVPGAGAYGFRFAAGNLAGFVNYRIDKIVTVFASGASGFRSPFVYVPKGTKEIWLSFNHQNSGGQKFLRPDGKIAETLVGGVYTIPVPDGMDGQLWRFAPGSTFRGQTFHNIPNLAAPSPETLMVPRALATRDGLKIRETP